jgi:DNA repair/transcription protein MET18/MMS19
VFGFVQAMDGEKDPRNLLLCFKLVPAIVQTVPEYIQFEEDLFDITSCYFPITFTERADDPFAVKKSDLVRSLRGTMIASPKLYASLFSAKFM